MSSAPPSKKPRVEKRYFKPNKKCFLEVGHRGFLATCNFREKDCVRESFNLLNQYANELYGPPEGGPAAEDTDKADDEAKSEKADIADDLEKEISAAKENAKKNSARRFHLAETGATNCIFIRTTLANPVELGTAIVKDIARTREQKSRFLLRLIPIEVVCRANLKEITDTGSVLFDKYFLKGGSTFSIVFNKRYNNEVRRDGVIAELAALVQSKNLGNRVDLKQPARTVVVEVIKGLCCMSVLENYFGYRKYNLVELASGDREAKVEKEATKSIGDDKDSKEEALENQENAVMEAPKVEADREEEKTDETSGEASSPEQGVEPTETVETQ